MGPITAAMAVTIAIAATALAMVLAAANGRVATMRVRRRPTMAPLARAPAAAAITMVARAGIAIAHRIAARAMVALAAEPAGAIFNGNSLQE